MKIDARDEVEVQSRVEGQDKSVARLIVHVSQLNRPLHFTFELINRLIKTQNFIPHASFFNFHTAYSKAVNQLDHTYILDLIFDLETHAFVTYITA